MKKEKKIEINEKNYQDYIELYQLKLNAIDKTSDILFGTYLVLMAGFLGSLAVTSVTMFPVNFLVTLALMVPANKIISTTVNKTMEKKFKKSHPDINPCVKLEKLEDVLQEEKILNEVYQLKPENYLMNQKVEKIKDEMRHDLRGNLRKTHISDLDYPAEFYPLNSEYLHQETPKVYKKVKKIDRNV